MRTWIDSRWFQRLLEIFPGFCAWTVILFPFIFAFWMPNLVVYFILIFTLYWFSKIFNIGRHMLSGLSLMKYNMRQDWYQKGRLLSQDLKAYQESLESDYQKTKARFPNRKRKYLQKEVEKIANLNGREELIINLTEIYHLIIIATFKEGFEILDETVKAITKSNYDKKKIIVALAGEQRDLENFTAISQKLEAKYKDQLHDFLYFAHEDQLGEVKGKGAGIAYAGHEMAKYLEQRGYQPEKILVTNIDADHVLHREYLAKLTYEYITDPDRDRKTYQPIALLFNNIWDAPAVNRIAAIASSFWIIMESMKPFRLRTFASHTQGLKTLLTTDFWSTTTIVEDGHQYWRTYFAYNGHIDMVPLFIPVYQDCVLDSTRWKTFKSQYLQRRRWAWGITDFAYVVKMFLKHPEIPFREKFLQTFRLFVNHLSWSTASLLLAVAWMPLVLNEDFMDQVIAQNFTRYSSTLGTIAWAGVFFSVWTFFSLLPPKPESHSRWRYVGMVTQWILTPPVTLLLTSFPALDAQTRLMFGKYLDFFVTPKVRKNVKIEIAGTNE